MQSIKTLEERLFFFPFGFLGHTTAPYSLFLKTECVSLGRLCGTWEEFLALQSGSSGLESLVSYYSSYYLEKVGSEFVSSPVR